MTRSAQTLLLAFAVAAPSCTYGTPGELYAAPLCAATYDANHAYQPTAFPISVALLEAPGAEGEASSRPDLSGAINFWNGISSVRLFVLSSSAPSCGTALVTQAQPKDRANTGQTVWNKCRAVISLAPNAGPEIAVHELGHVLNLRHEEGELMAHVPLNLDLSEHSRCLIEAAVLEGEAEGRDGN